MSGGRYRRVEVQMDGLFECVDCAALVADRQLHDQAVHDDWTPTVHDHAPGDLPPAQVPNRQYGGPVTRGQPYLVGEQGPEIILPKDET